MPTQTGNSVKGYQNLGVGFTPTNRAMELTTPTRNSQQVDRVGFLYLIDAIPGPITRQRVIVSKLMYTPGIIIDIPASVNLAGSSFFVAVEWNVSGLAWRLTYT